MPFKIPKNPTYWTDCEFEGMKFRLKFNRFSQSQIEAFATENLDGDAVIDKALAGWDGVQNEDGTPMEFDATSKATFLDVAGMKVYVVNRFYASVYQADRKNS